MRVPAEARIPLQSHNCRAYNERTVYTGVGKFRKPIRNSEASSPWQLWDVQRVLAEETAEEELLAQRAAASGRPTAQSKKKEDIPLSLLQPFYHPHGNLLAWSMGNRYVESSLLRQEGVEESRHEGEVD